jgi:NAD dependent epimerase/dehydratase family enzyme
LKPKVLVSSSAIGYYGTSESCAFDEASPSGKDYLAEVCREWEAAAQSLDDTTTRLVLIRNGIVLAKDGGVLAQMVPIFSIFAGGPLGSGKQWLEYLFCPHTPSAHMSSSIIASLISLFLCTTLLLCHQRKF